MDSGVLGAAAPILDNSFEEAPQQAAGLLHFTLLYGHRGPETGQWLKPTVEVNFRVSLRSADYEYAWRGDIPCSTSLGRFRLSM